MRTSLLRASWAVFATKGSRILSCVPSEFCCIASCSKPTILSNQWFLPVRLIHDSPVFRVAEKLSASEVNPSGSRGIPKRSLRKRRPLTAIYDCHPTQAPQIVSVALAESFDLVNVVKDERLTSLYVVTCVDEESDEGLHFVPKPEYVINREAVREFFIFEDGVAVFWGIDDAERERLLSLLSNHASSAYKERIVNEETDSMSFSLATEGKSRISKDELCLSISKDKGGHTDNASILERYAFSHGMAASVKIGIWESQLSDLAEPLSTTTKALARGIIPWKRKEALQKTGQFADLRHSINLNCDLLNSDFYWERENLERFYLMALYHFSVYKRLKLLNSRLDYCENLVQIIDGMLSHRHASTLEWMIIILIVIEVVFDLWHFLDSSAEKGVASVFRNRTVLPKESA